MQYTGNCIKPDCDVCIKAPNERQVRNQLQDHLEDSGHVGQVTGVYDSPSQGGWYTADGYVDDDLSQSQQMAIRDEEKLMDQIAGQYESRDDSEMWSIKHDTYERIKSILTN